MADFITYQLALAHTPLSREWGEAWNLISAVMRDVMISGAKDATKVRFIGVCPDDVLTKHGLARVLPKSPNETNDSYRLRLLDAFDTWLLAGTSAGVERALEVVGGPGCEATVIENQDWDPPDHDATKWWRFWVIIDGLNIATDGNWDDPGTWDDGGVWDLAGATGLVDLIRTALRTWKAAHTICVDVELILPFGGGSIHFVP